MKNTKFIFFPLIIIILTCCSDSESSISDKRITAITISSSSTDDRADYRFRYNLDSRLSSIDFGDNPLISYKYNGDMLAGYEFQDRRYSFIYENEKVVKIERDSMLPVGWPTGLKRHFLEITYQYHNDGSFTRRDSSITYNYSDNSYPPSTNITINDISLNRHLSEVLSYFETDTVDQISFETIITYSQDAPNPLLGYNFPVAYNPIVFHPFLLSEFVVRVPEIFLSTSFLPRTIKLKRDGAAVRTTIFTYTFEDGLLTIIKANIDDHPGGRSAPGYPVETIADIVWK